MMNPINQRMGPQTTNTVNRCKGFSEKPAGSKALITKQNAPTIDHTIRMMSNIFIKIMRQPFDGSR